MITKGDYTMIYSGGLEHSHGVGIVMSNKIRKCMTGYWPVNDRIIMCKIKATPFDLAVVQVYAPTSDYSDEEVEEFYENLQEVLKQVKSTDVLLILGDFNAKVGTTAMSTCLGKYGLGKTNERGETLINFCERTKLTIVNTQFKQPSRKLYTCKSPGDIRRNQIDYILLRARFRNSVINCKTYPGADIGSDNNPVIMKMHLKLKVPNKKQSSTKKYCTGLLRCPQEAAKYAIAVKNKYEALYTEDTEMTKDIDMQWDSLKKAILQTNDEILPEMKRETKQDWITKDILQMMEERKRLKGTEAYNRLDNNIKKACKSAQEDWLNAKCEEIETLSKTNNMTTLYQKVKTFSRKQTKTGNCIKDKSGNILFEADQIVMRWNEYVEELFADQRVGNPVQEYLLGPDIMKEEVRKCLHDMKTGKAAGIDNISTEMLKALGEFGIEALTDLCNKMYHSAYIPEDLKTSIFVLLPKKPRALDCSDYRTISLMCHVLKLLLTVIHRRMVMKIDREIAEAQAGFRKESGTREAIFDLKILAEKYIEMQKEIYACFIDYSKAFDSVKHTKMIEAMQKTDMDENDIALVSHLYWEQKTRIRIDGAISEEVNIQKGVRQGCVLSPSLFNLYTEYIFREIDQMSGLKINGETINNLRYADDTVLLAENEDDLQNLVSTIEIQSEKFGLLMNVKKTKAMVISKNEAAKVTIKVNDKIIEQVDQFTYLGQLITTDGRSEQEIKRRIVIAKNSFAKLSNLLTNKKVDIKTRIRITRCFVWSTFLYACETWTLSKAVEKKIEAMEMWMYRRMSKISWKEKKTNMEVLKIVGVKRPELLLTIKSKKLAYYGHIRRHDSVHKRILEGKVIGKRGRGRRRQSWLTNIEEMTQQKMSLCCETALLRDRWKTMTANPGDRNAP